MPRIVKGLTMATRCNAPATKYQPGGRFAFFRMCDSHAARAVRRWAELEIEHDSKPIGPCDVPIDGPYAVNWTTGYEPAHGCSPNAEKVTRIAGP